MKFILLVFFFHWFPVMRFLTKLSTRSSDFFYGDSPIFLNGVNQAWVNYGDDFGNSQPISKFCSLNQTLYKTKANGGNSIRIWLHIEGDKSPLFNSSGYVIATDSSKTLISEMRQYLQAANDMNVLIFFVLWNGALMRNSQTVGMLTDQKKLQSYIDNCLIPIVKDLANESALGGWEIMNEPEGSLVVTSDVEPCYNTAKLTGSGAGWAGQLFTMRQVLWFVNILTSAIKVADPYTLVTIGSWSERTQTNSFGYYNYYSDSCLIKAGGKTNGILDFYQMHTYSWQGVFSASSPMKNNINSFGLNKPLVVGEFNQENGGGMSIQTLYKYVYNQGYNGAWGWTAESQFNNFDGMVTLKGLNKTVLNIQTRPNMKPLCDGGVDGGKTGGDCSDTAPDSSYTCAQQAGWGKCSERWMQGFCCKTCFNCNCPKCSDNAPDNSYSCQQQSGWNKCGESWMKGYCCSSCFNCQGCK